MNLQRLKDINPESPIQKSLHVTEPDQAELKVVDAFIQVTSTIAAGPPRHPTFTSYPTRRGERLKFKTFRNVFIDAWQTRDLREQKANAFANQMLSSAEHTELWDDKWYFTSTPVNTMIFMVWVNIDLRRFSYAWMRNAPDRWNVGHTSGVYTTISNGYEDRKKIPYAIDSTGGELLEVDVWNPNNDTNDCNGDGWTPCDMIVSWGRG